ncbi:hypothetical protein [Streptomyces melanogenes]|uniref:Lipoprotein n=1 Tax=Streptomyces melanogenes TaxID=67326 RepID=A0ABZ1XT20_9ACTN|nr:hypothetical protein [Streptomyces melanogenes]
MGSLDARRWRTAVLPLSFSALLVTAACSDQEGAPTAASTHSGSPSPSTSRLSKADCDDDVVPVSRPPAKLSREGQKAVGSGSIWFIAPRTDSWSDILERQGAVRRGKFPLWVDQRSLPQVSVEGIRGTAGTGRAHVTPTSEGIPGPLPMSVELPSPGCWQVTVKGDGSTTRILLNAA